jgi:hypothetical protein
MSFELDYFPPNGTKWKWSSKALNYSPWLCNLARQKEPGLNLWPLDVMLIVDLVKDRWVWQVEVIDFQHQRAIIKGAENDPLKACFAAEIAGEGVLADLLPDWVRAALANKWRPPAT